MYRDDADEVVDKEIEEEEAVAEVGATHRAVYENWRLSKNWGVGRDGIYCWTRDEEEDDDEDDEVDNESAEGVHELLYSPEATVDSVGTK